MIIQCIDNALETETYYPNFLVDKVKGELQKVIDLLETGETDTEVIQEKLDEVVCAIKIGRAHV